MPDLIAAVTPETTAEERAQWLNDLTERGMFFSNRPTQKALAELLRDFDKLSAEIVRLRSRASPAGSEEVEGLVERLDELARKATARPWPNDAEEFGKRFLCAFTDEKYPRFWSHDDLPFIVALVNAYPQLRAALAKQAAALAERTKERDEARERASDAYYAHQRECAKDWQLRHPGQTYADIHARWWMNPADVPLVGESSSEIVDAIVAALLQESMTAWNGDGTGIVAHMVRAQGDKRQAAEAEASRLREALTRIRDGNFDWAAGSMRQIAREALATLNPDPENNEEPKQ